MKKPSKIDQLNRNLEMAKSNRRVPSVGIAARLAIHETRIEKHLTNIDTSFFEIGKELAEIQAEQDFGERTFEEYIKNRWGKERTWGYRMIEGYKVKAGLPTDVAPGIQTEKQARALKAAPPEKRAEVLREASKDGAPSARKIAEVIEAEHRVVVTDANGAEVPEAIAAEFQKSRDEAKHVIGLLNEARRWFEDEQVFKAELARTECIEGTKAIISMVRQAAGDYLCPICQGKKCKVCSKRGFVSKLFYNQKISDDKK